MTTETNTNLLIIVDFDGTHDSGIYRVYPANEESEPDCEFWSEFVYDVRSPNPRWPHEYSSQSYARQAAQEEAKSLAKHIGGMWATNE